MPTPQLYCPDAPDNDGAFALHWRGDAATWSLAENGVVRYSGADTATTLTGRVAGAYEYRVAAVEDGAATWSEPCVVEVAPPSIALALALAAVGAAVFVATLLLVMSGDRTARQERT